MPVETESYRSKLRKYCLYVLRLPVRYWRRSWLSKLLIILIALIFLLTSAMAAIGEWYISTQANIPLTYGVSFIPDYAQSLGLNPEATMKALLNIGVRQFRLTSYWSDIEPTKNNYDFSQLDWELNLANRYHAKVILTIGLRQPRWPECHPPSWINTSAPMNTWEPALLSFMSKVINRYKGNPALEAWQLENEYFLQGFGACTNFSRARLVSEYQLLKQLDPAHSVIIGRSNNALGLPLGSPTPDFYGISIYKRVWDAAVTHRYLEYPYPGWFYGFLAGIQEIHQGRNMIIDELQAEAWPPNGQTIPHTSLYEQNKSLSAQRLEHRFAFGKSTGVKDIMLWGAEYWYYRMVILNDPSLWNVAKQQFKANDYHSGAYLLSHPNL